jgi:hypothetical protein
MAGAENEQGRKIKKQLPPAPQKEKTRGHHDCMLNLPNGLTFINNSGSINKPKMRKVGPKFFRP